MIRQNYFSLKKLFSVFVCRFCSSSFYCSFKLGVSVFAAVWRRSLHFGGIWTPLFPLLFRSPFCPVLEVKPTKAVHENFEANCNETCKRIILLYALQKRKKKKKHFCLFPHNHDNWKQPNNDNAIFNFISFELSLVFFSKCFAALKSSQQG